MSDQTVDWTKVAALSAAAALIPWLMGYMAKRQLEAERRAMTPRWTDAARWER